MNKNKVIKLLNIIVILLGISLIIVGFFAKIIAPILSGIAFILIVMINKYSKL